MGIISSSPNEENSQNNANKENKQEKYPKDNMKHHKSMKRPKNNKNIKNKNTKTIVTDTTKKIFKNKIIKVKNKSPYTTKTFSLIRFHSKEKQKPKKNPEVKNIIFKSKQRKAISQEKQKKKYSIKNFNTKGEKIKHNINYNNFSKGIEEDDFDIINNDNYDDFYEKLEIIGPKRNINNNKIQNKILKEKINNTKKKIINLRKKLNTEINNSSKNINVKNNIENNFIMNNNNIKPNKISNTIVINNSNITISNTNSSRKKVNNSLSIEDNNKYNNNIYNTSTYLNQKIPSIEINNFLSNDFPKINKINPNYYYTESDLNFQPIKTKNEYFSDLSWSQYDSQTFKKPEENIINKIGKLKDKIKPKIQHKFTPSRLRTTYPIFTHKIINKIKKNETLDNKHIINNIPSYRRSHSKSKNNFSSNLLLNSLDRKENMKNRIYGKSLFNSNIKTKSMKSNYNFSFKRREKNRTNDRRYSQSDENNNNIKLENIQLNIPTLKDISSNKLLVEKKIKNKNLYNIITQNIIKEETNNNKNSSDINNIDQILLLKYRDAFDIDISSINVKESLIDKDLLESNINNKIIINFSKLENISLSQILFDGNIYKVVDNTSNKSQKKFKIMERYFQLKKNCFRYFNNIQLAKYNKDKPLVQFDIRHIKDLKIIDSKIFDEYDLNEKKIAFSFAIFLNQNSDFFVFVLDNKDFGNSLFGLLNLLKNYYEDKKDYKA